MPQPQHTFMVINGKAKVVADAKDSKAKMQAPKGGQRVNVVDYLLQRAKVPAALLPSGLKFLEDARKAAQERVEETTLGKAKAVVEKVKELCEQYEKLDSAEKQATAALHRPTMAVIRAPELTPGMDVKAFVSVLDVVIILLTVLIQLRAKGTR